MDATQPPVTRSRRLPGRACAVALAMGLIAACGGNTSSPTADEGPAYAPPASTPAVTEVEPAEEDPAEDGASEEATSAEATQEAAATDDDADDDAGLVIVIEEFTYEVPGSVPPGAQVTVRNEDGVGHTVTSDDGAEFDTVVGPGEEVTFTAPDEPGDYPFHCTPHPTMTSTLVVEG